MRIVDITHVIHGEMQRFSAAWHCQTEIFQMGAVGCVGRNTSKISIGSHAGTHMDAPRHFIPDGETIDRVPISVMLGEAQLVDFRSIRESGFVTIDAIRSIKLSERMIFDFGWSKNWGSDAFYHNYPYFSDEAADYLSNSGVVKLIGMDTPSPDDSRIKLFTSEDSKIHKKFLSSGIVLVEYLNLSEVKEYGEWNFAALPLKIKGCDGSPVRAVIYK